MPFDQFVQFVVFAPPGTAIYYLLNEGWTPDTHRLTDILDVSALAMWLNTSDAQEKHPKYKPTPQPRPGGQGEMPAPEPYMTVEQYMELNGM